jgi:hypothetical protein
MVDRVIEKNLIGIEDLVLYEPSLYVTQARASGNVNLYNVDATKLPFRDDTSVTIASAISAQASSSTNFTSAASLINTVLKETGFKVFYTVTNRPLWATGPNPTDPWVDAYGVVVFTPS